MEQFSTLLALAYEQPTVAMKLSAMDMIQEGDMTEVKESSYHGLGIFAKKDIPIGTLITIYPIHQYALRTKEKNTWEVKSTFNDKELYEGYGLNIDDNTKIYGCPTFHSNYMFNGHIANDPVMSLDHSDINKFILSYIFATKIKGNTKYQKDKHIVSLIAVKDIKAGEEILVPYSLQYWFYIFKLNTDETMTNFQRYLETLPIHKHKFIVDLMFEVSKLFG